MVDERENSFNHIVLMLLLPPVFVYIFINLDLNLDLNLDPNFWDCLNC